MLKNIYRLQLAYCGADMAFADMIPSVPPSPPPPSPHPPLFIPLPPSLFFIRQALTASVFFSDTSLNYELIRCSTALLAGCMLTACNSDVCMCASGTVNTLCFV